ncbi:MAG: MarR family transcriptional regulator [Alphaproteobacteria bacterium]|nr:MarR family transcriptional regulator [Alphaproteobacteria bacterium]
MRGDGERADDLERSVGFLLGDVSRLLRIVYDRRVEHLGLTRAQWRVLAHLNRRQGITQSELAQVLEIEKPSLGKLVDRLEAKGWVERHADDRDLRTRRLFISERARALIDEMMTLAAGVKGDALAGLAPGAEDRLIDALLHIKANLARLIAEGEVADGGRALEVIADGSEG